MIKKSPKIDSGLPQEEILKENKYFRTVLLSYYMLTRNVDIFPAYEKLKDDKILTDLFEEYKRYVAGYDLSIYLDNEKQENTFKAPDFTTIKPNTILQILKKNPKF